ncbi:MAG: HAD-IA family hydrolase [Acidobacteria bacterium]|nr:HAD-IA family hydrolase [Acidobacteriota bacterium]
MPADLLVFDMDGVLVDVSESYRETIRQTVFNFTGGEITNRDIQDLKNQGGWNNDWRVAHHFVLCAGVEVSYEQVVEYFQRIFFGADGSAGLIRRERWVAAPGLLERLALRYQLAIYTGRIRPEVSYTLARSAPGLRFHPIITTDDVARSKPDPEGLLRIAELVPGRKLWYVGDTLDDARCARAAGAPFIGVAAPSNPRAAELARLLRQEGALAVLDDVNQLEAVLP